ncbi:LOW QUALITY PROTEIN: hypothetical protein YC2023_123920 [Brassica napus]
MGWRYSQSMVLFFYLSRLLSKKVSLGDITSNPPIREKVAKERESRSPAIGRRVSVRAVAGDRHPSDKSPRLCFTFVSDGFRLLWSVTLGGGSVTGVKTRRSEGRRGEAVCVFGPGRWRLSSVSLTSSASVSRRGLVARVWALVMERKRFHRVVNFRVVDSPSRDDALRQVLSVVKKRCGFGGGSKGFRAPANRDFQWLGTAAWEGGDGRVEAERRVAH